MAGQSDVLAATAKSGAPKPLGCVIEPDRVADIGSQVVGLVARLLVARGDRVLADQPLVVLRAEVERANVGVADSRARVDAEVQAARASLLLAEQKMRRAESLAAVKFVSTQAVEQAAAELEVARQKVVQTRAQQRIAVDERRLAEAQLALRTVRSPFDGVVVERFIDVGERVEEKPLLRVAVTDPLRVELMVPSAKYGFVSVGDQLRVRPELPGVEPVLATVIQVDSVFDAASNSFLVRLTLPNPHNRLPAGLRCKVDFPDVAGGEMPLAAASAMSPQLRIETTLGASRGVTRPIVQR
ncbi:MAG: efflux RND transporter periplasmic adaptor subunit, partial [Propionivibrio sp.]